MKRHWIVLGILTCSAGLIASILAVGLFTSRSSQQYHGGGRGAHIGLVNITLPNIPPGYGRPLTMAPDPSASGVWFVAGSASDVSIFHWNGAVSNLSQYSLGSPASDPALQIGAEGSITVTLVTVWVGLRNTLFELDRSTGQITSVAVPPPIDNSYVESSRPSAVQGFHGISSVSASPNGSVAIAMEAARSVVIYDPSSGKFSQLALPESDSPDNVAYASNGDLGVVATEWPSNVEDVVDIAAPDGALQRVRLDSLAISSDGSGFLVSGSSSVSEIQPQSPGSDVMGAPTVAYQADPAAAAGLEQGTAAEPLQGGEIVLATTTGFVISDPTGATRVFTLPRIACLPGGVPLGSPSEPNVGCQLYAISFTVDSVGNIWFAYNLGDNVGEVPVGSY